MKAAVIGGDKRMLFAAKEFLSEGFDVSIAGFDRLLSLCDIRVTDIDTACAWADIVILPVRPMQGDLLNAPFCDDPCPISQLMDKVGDKPVFTGCGEVIRRYAAGDVFDYSRQADFVYRNAWLTAEGAVGILINDYEGSVSGTWILVTGYGRIGKLLSNILRDLGADVTVAARKDSDRALAVQNRLTAVRFDEIDYERYPVIFNTVPALIADAKAVDSMRGDVFIVDLASMPGGIDFGRAKQRGLSCIHALSLPGKTAPLAAGRVIKDTIMDIIRSHYEAPKGADSMPSQRQFAVSSS